MYRKAVFLSMMLVFSAAILSGPGASNDYEMEGVTYEPYFFKGGQGDVFKVVLDNASSPVDLMIMTYYEYYQWIYFKGKYPAKPVWEVEDASWGAWDWSPPWNDSYTLVIWYPDDQVITYDLWVKDTDNLTLEEQLQVSELELRHSKEEAQSLMAEKLGLEAEMNRTASQLEELQRELAEMRQSLEALSSANQTGNAAARAGKGEDRAWYKPLLLGLFLGAVITAISAAILFKMIKRPVKDRGSKRKARP